MKFLKKFQIAREKPFDDMLITHMQFIFIHLLHVNSDYNFLFCLRLIDLLSANQHAKSFACIWINIVTNEVFKRMDFLKEDFVVFK